MQNSLWTVCLFYFREKSFHKDITCSVQRVPDKKTNFEISGKMCKNFKYNEAKWKSKNEYKNHFKLLNVLQLQNVRI